MLEAALIVYLSAIIAFAVWWDKRTARKRGNDVRPDWRITIVTVVIIVVIGVERLIT